MLVALVAGQEPLASADLATQASAHASASGLAETTDGRIRQTEYRGLAAADADGALAQRLGHADRSHTNQPVSGKLSGQGLPRRGPTHGVHAPKMTGREALR